MSSDPLRIAVAEWFRQCASRKVILGGGAPPRALDNRSILVDPRNPNMKDIVDAKIKFRKSARYMRSNSIISPVITHHRLVERLVSTAP